MSTTTTTTTTAPAAPPRPISSKAGASQTLPGRPFVLLPLYIYPAPAAWAPLYDAAGAHPELDFYVVVNPSNGPGDGALPDANYVGALVRLTALRNVRVIGYVHCSYGARPAEEIVADVEAYGRWEGEMAAQGREGRETIVVDGIFMDETPSSTEFVEYMAALSNAAKTILNRNVLVPAETTTNTTAATTNTKPEDEREAVEHAGTAEDKDAAGSPPGPSTPPASSAVVIYNPGVVVDPIFYQAADYVVAFENAARQWGDAAVRQGFSRLPPALAARSVAVAHGAEAGLVEVAQVSRRAAEAGCRGAFVTSRGGYTEWCPSWAEFVADMARRTAI